MIASNFEIVLLCFTLMIFHTTVHPLVFTPKVACKNRSKEGQLYSQATSFSEGVFVFVFSLFVFGSLGLHFHFTLCLHYQFPRQLYLELVRQTAKQKERLTN